MGAGGDFVDSVPSEACDVGLDQLHVRDSVRHGVSEAHVRMLMEIEKKWPPIVVACKDSRIIDGVHRYMAALKLGRRSITCRFFDGDIADGMVLAIRLNSGNG